MRHAPPRARSTFATLAMTLMLGALVVAFVAAVALVLAGAGFARGRSVLVGLPPPSRAEVADATFSVEGRPVRVLALPTGVVSIKGCHAVGCLPEAFPFPLRFLAIVADPTFGARLPVWTYAIAHPEGTWLVDAGASTRFGEDASWETDPVSGALIRGFLRLDTSRAESLPARLDAAGLRAADVRGLVLTHQHVDHTGEVPAFPGADVWTNAAEDAAARFIGAVPFLWRDATMRVRHVDTEGSRDAGEPWTGVALTRDGRLRALHTPGHTPGSITVVLRTDAGDVYFIGDTSFRARDLTPATPTTGMHFDVPGARAVQAWLASRPGPRVFLAAHDDAVPTLLRAGPR